MIARGLNRMAVARKTRRLEKADALTRHRTVAASLREAIRQLTWERDELTSAIAVLSKALAQHVGQDGG